MRNYSRLDAFLNRSSADQSAQARDLLHDAIASNAFARLMHHYGPVENEPVALDVGCGVGADLLRFKQAGFYPVGITLDFANVTPEVAKYAHEAEQEFMPDEWTEGFDVLWSRHVAEHSVAPAFTLEEYARVLRPRSWAYIEVPGCQSPQRWEEHEAHRSVLPVGMWRTLIQRAGFDIVEAREVVFTAYNPVTNESLDGQDYWLQWYLRKR